MFDFDYFSLSLSENFLLNALRNLLILLEEHGVVTTTLSLWNEGLWNSRTSQPAEHKP